MNKNKDEDINNQHTSSPTRGLPKAQNFNALETKCDEIESKCDLPPCNSIADNDPCTSPNEDSHEDNQEHRKCPRPATKDKNPRYGWVVVLACFLNHFILGGFDRCDGVFFLLFLDKFHHSAQLTAWPLAIASSLQMLVSPVASAMCDRYSTRTTAIAGGAITFVSMILNSLAPNFYFLFFSHAILGGIGGGLPFVPGLILINKYFTERVGMATALATSGVGLGTFLLNPFVQYLSETYGYQGTFLILGAFSCNMFVVAMLYRPLSMHLKFISSSQMCKMTDQKPSSNDMKLESLCENEESFMPLNDLSTPSSEKQSDHPEMIISASDEQSRKSFANTLHENQKSSNCFTASLKMCFPIEETNETEKSQRKLFHSELLKQPPFVTFCLTMWLFSIGYRSAFTFLPALVEHKGNSDYEAALSLSIAGAADTVGRAASGVILDLGKLRPYRPIIYTFVVFGMALSSFILPSLSSFASFIPLCIFYGVMIGTFISHKSVVLSDIVGQENMAKTLGILIGVQGFANFIGPPISGALKDIYGSYNPPFYFGGSVMMLAGFSMALSNFLQRKKAIEK